jgi:hypothetical protein
MQSAVRGAEPRLGGDGARVSDPPQPPQNFSLPSFRKPQDGCIPSPPMVQTGRQGRSSASVAHHGTVAFLSASRPEHRQIDVEAGRFQRDEKQAAEAVSRGRRVLASSAGF